MVPLATGLDLKSTGPKPHYVPYATSKAGLEMMTKITNN